MQRSKPPEGPLSAPDPDGCPELAALAEIGAAASGGAAAESTRGARRLLEAVSALPRRYAPFYRRLAELWQLSEAEVARELGRARLSRHWRRSLLPGVRTFALWPSGPSGAARARLICFEPGVRFPRHRHRGCERVLVLEGSYVDGTGDLVGAGDARMMPPGSEHDLTVIGDGDCVAAGADHGIELTDTWWNLLRTLL